MEKTIFDIYSQSEIEDIIESIILMLNDKYKDEDILNKLKCELKEEFLSIAKARLKSDSESGKFVGGKRYFNLDDLRFTTPKIVSDYRAQRLSCKKIVDLCSGIGIQSGSFAKTCKNVLGIEIDTRKVKYSSENFKDSENLKFICGDVLNKEIIEKVREFEPDIIFCDPERLPQEKERNLESIKPNMKRLIEIYSKICPNLCIEIPPQINIDKLKEFDCEKEYLSLNNKLNRLDLYFGELKESEVSVVDVISGDRIEKNDSIKKPRKANKVFAYLYEVSPAIEKAGVENEFAKELGLLILKGSEGKLLMTSEELSEDFKGFYKSYQAFYITPNFNDINRILKKDGFGKVVLKYSINPKDYWRERNTLERGLRGDIECVVFNIEGRYVLCRELD